MEEKKKEEPLNGEIVKLIKQRTYLWCTIIIIGFFVINQFALMHCSNKVLADQFTFASTISSIILSVIAIIMSVVSSDSINSLLHKFRDLHDEIKDVPGTIDSSIGEMNKASDKFEEINETLKGLPQKIDDSTTVMTEVSEYVNDAMEKLSKLVTEVLDKTNSLDLIGEDVRTLKEALTKTNEQELTNRIQLTSEQVEKIVKTGSPYGALLLYAAKLAKDQNKILSLNELSFAMGKKNLEDYLYAYCVAMKAVGLITGEQLESEYLFVIKEYDKNMQSVKEMLLERMDNNSEVIEIFNAIDKLMTDALIVPADGE